MYRSNRVSVLHNGERYTCYYGNDSAYNEYADFWATGPSLTSKIGPGVAGSSYHYLVFGGKNDTASLSRLTQETRDGVVTSKANMLYASTENYTHMSGAGTALDAIAAGGYNYPQGMSAVLGRLYRFNGSTNVWSDVQAVPIPGFSIGMTGTATNALLFGGRTNNTYSYTAYTFNGTSFTATGSMPVSRGCTGVGTPSATLCVGGSGQSNVDRKTYYFNGSTWSTLSDQPTAYYYQAVFGSAQNAFIAKRLVNSLKWNGTAWRYAAYMPTYDYSGSAGAGRQTNGVVVGGEDSDTGYKLNYAMYYFETTLFVNKAFSDVWGSHSTLPSAKSGMACVAEEGGLKYTVFTSGYHYSCSGNSWFIHTAPSCGEYNGGCGEVDFYTFQWKVMAFGGSPSLSSAFAWDGSAWTTVDSMTTGRHHLGSCGTAKGSVAIGQWALATNGSSNGYSTSTTEIYAYSYGSYAWVSGGSTPEAMFAHITCGTVYDALSVGQINNAYLYDGVVWYLTSSSPIITGRYWAAGFGRNTLGIMFVGGFAANTRYSTTMKYTGDTWSSAANYPIAVYYAAGGGAFGSGIIAGGNTSSGDTTAVYKYL